MTTLIPTLLMVLLSTSLMPIDSTGSPQQTQPSQAASLPNPEETRRITIVKSKAPWYAFDWLLAREFRKVVPVYQRVDGLQFKAFSSLKTDTGKFFGGIYLWKSEKQAQNWFTPKWFADIEQKRGYKPTVDFYAVMNDVVFVEPTFDYRQREGDCVTIFIPAINPELSHQCLTKQPGLLRTYLVREPTNQQGALVLFDSARQARAFLLNYQITRYEWFKTPVLLNNVR